MELLKINLFYYVVFFVCAAVIPYGVEFLKYILKNYVFAFMVYIAWKLFKKTVEFKRSISKELAFILSCLLVFTFNHGIIESVVLIDWTGYALWAILVFHYTDLFLTATVISLGTNQLAKLYEEKIYSFGDPSKTISK